MQEIPFLAVELTVNAPVDKVWQAWITPHDVRQWNIPSADWHCPRVEMDLREEGRFLFRMGTKDGSESFDHAGVYDTVLRHEQITYTTYEGRKSKIVFTPHENATLITETFEPDASLSSALQTDFVRAILESFKEHVEKQQTTKPEPLIQK